MSFSLGPRQTQTVAAAITVLSTLIIVLAVGSLLFLMGLFFRAFSHVFLPVAVAGVAALVTKPLYDWLLQFKLVGPITALVLVFLAMLIPLVALGWFFGAILVKQIAELVERMPGYWEAARDWFAASWPEVRDFWENSELGQRVRTTLEEQQSNVLQGLQIFGEGFLSAGRGALRGIGTLFT
jgi:predicted PurR-regulated permease PerM